MVNIAAAVGGMLLLTSFHGCASLKQPVPSVRVEPSIRPMQRSVRPVWVASWSPVPEDCRHITPMIVLGGVFDPFGESTATISPERAASASRSRPNGRAAIRWDRYARSLFAHDAELLKSGGERADPEFWQTASVERTRAEWAAWLARFHASGGVLDYLIGDCEEWNIYSSWSLSQRQIDRLASSPKALLRTTFAPALRELLADTDVAKVKDYLGTGDYLGWNRAVGRIAAGTMHAAIWNPAAERYPDLRGSNFCGKRMLDRPAPDRNGHPQPYDNRVGTANSIGEYGRIEHAATAWFVDPSDATRLSKTGTRRLEVTPWTSFMLDVQAARACRRTDPGVMLQPWIALPSWRGVGNSRVAYPDDPKYYDEMLRHLALHGTETFLLWNPRASDSLGIAEADRPTGARRIDRVVGEIQAATGGVVAETTVRDPISFDASFVLSSARLATGDVLLRVTLGPNADALRDAASGRIFRRDAGTHGFWLSLGRDGVLPRFEVQPVGRPDGPGRSG